MVGQPWSPGGFTPPEEGTRLGKLRLVRFLALTLCYFLTIRISIAAGWLEEDDAADEGDQGEGAETRVEGPDAEIPPIEATTGTEDVAQVQVAS
jgi:hypothetical protein